MSAKSEVVAEREVDLGSWWRAVGGKWGWVLGAVVAGGFAGNLYSSHLGNTYKAAALVSLGQVTSPAGEAIGTFAVDPHAVAQIVGSPAAQAEAATQAGVSASALRGHVSVVPVAGSSIVTATGHGPLVVLTVTGSRPGAVAAAANALARIVVRKTTQPYVSARKAIFGSFLRSVDARLASISVRLRRLERSLKRRRLAPLERLVVAGQVGNLETARGDLIAQQGEVRTNLFFATNVDAARTITAAQATQAGARPRLLSLLVGALIAFILAAFAAIRRPM